MAAATEQIEGFVTLIAEGLNHPLRRAILREMRESERWSVSPKVLSNIMDEPLTNVSYHVRELAKRGLVLETSTVPRRGALEHLYIRTPLGTAAIESCQAIEKRVIKSLSPEARALRSVS